MATNSNGPRSPALFVVLIEGAKRDVEFFGDFGIAKVLFHSSSFHMERLIHFQAVARSRFGRLVRETGFCPLKQARNCFLRVKKVILFSLDNCKIKKLSEGHFSAGTRVHLRAFP